MKRVYLRLFGIEKFRGKCFLEHFISNFHIFPYNALQTCHFHILYVFPFQIYPPRKFGLWFMKRVYLRLFGIEKFRGKCFLEHFISNFHIFPYNALQTCHFHILYVFPFQICPPRKFNYVYEKGSIYVFLASRSFGESVSQSTLYQIFTFSHIMHCKHVIFTFCMYFRFKYTPLVNSTMVYEKGSIYVFLASRSFGESVSQSTLYQIFTFSHIMHCKHVIFTFCMYFRFKYIPPRKFKYGL